MPVPGFQMEKRQDGAFTRLAAFFTSQHLIVSYSIPKGRSLCLNSTAIRHTF